MQIQLLYSHFISSSNIRFFIVIDHFILQRRWGIGDFSMGLFSTLTWPGYGLLILLLAIKDLLWMLRWTVIHAVGEKQV